MTISISVSDKYDGGNIKFIRTEINSNDSSILNVIVQIRPDVYTELENICHMQYFSFQVTISGLNSNEKQIIHYIIENASQVSYPDAWDGSSIFYSTELDNDTLWKRNIKTYYTNNQLWWEQEHTCTKVDDESMYQPIIMYFCYFPPYTRQRHEQFKNNSLQLYHIHKNLGYTKMKNPIDCYKIGSGPLIGWIICRQHPGETMAEFYAEGLLKRLLQLKDNDNNDNDNNNTFIDPLMCGDDDQPISQLSLSVEDTIVEQVLQLYTLYIVPCMCPDGVQLGHLRTNSVGANLNREWATVPSSSDYIAPSIERSPEVYYVLEHIKKTGCNFFLDVHGDEELPYNFTNSPINIPNWNNRLQSLHGAFTGCYSRINNDMQCIYGYPAIINPEFVLNYMNIATHQIAYTFNCLSVTLEMPFKDCITNSDPIQGWSPIRSQQLGSSLVDVLLYMEQYIRITDSNDPIWNNMPVDDVYIPTKSIYDNDNSNNSNNKAEDDDDDDDDDDKNYNDEHFNKPLTRFYSDVYEKRKTDIPTHTTRTTRTTANTESSVNNIDSNTLPSINEK